MATATTSSTTQTVNIYEAKTKLSKLVDLAAAGQDIVIARNGRPVALLTYLDNKHKSVTGLGALKGKGWIAEDFDAPLPDHILAEFEGR